MRQPPLLPQLRLLPLPFEDDDDVDARLQATLVDGVLVAPGRIESGGLALRDSLFHEANVRVYNDLGGAFLRAVPCTQRLEYLVTEDEDERFAGLYFYDTGSAAVAVFMMAFRGDAAWTLFHCVGEERKSIRTGTSRDTLRSIFVGPGMPIFLYDRNQRFLGLAERLLKEPLPAPAQHLKLQVELCRHLQRGGARREGMGDSSGDGGGDGDGTGGASGGFVCVYQGQALYQPLGDGVLYRTNDDDADDGGAIEDSLRFASFAGEGGARGARMSIFAFCRGCSKPPDEGRRVTRTMAAALSAQQTAATTVPNVSVAQVEPQMYAAQDHASLDALFDRIRGNRALHGALPSQDGSFYVLASHGFRRNVTPNLWDAWPAYLGRVPAVDAGMDEFVVKGRKDGLVPAVRIDFHAGESVFQVLLRMNQVFWGPDGAPSTYLARNEHLGYGGPWGFLVQFRGAQVELLIGVPYTTVKRGVHEPVPVLALRKSLAVPFTPVKQNLEEIDMASLGLHVEAAHVTAFRFHQGSKADPFLEGTKKDRKFLILAEDVLTLVKRTAGGRPVHHLIVQRSRKRAAAEDVGVAATGSGATHKRQRRSDGSDGSSSGGRSEEGAGAAADAMGLGPDGPSSCCRHLIPWPLHGFVISQLLGGHGGVRSTELHRAHIGLLTFLGLECNPKPVFNLLALVCARVLPVLPESLIDTYQQLRQRWRQQPGGCNHDAPWGPRMDVLSWSSADGPDAPQDCMQQYIVSLPPTAEQMRGLESVEQRLALLAAALGVPALVVNANLTKEQCSNFHRIVEAIAAWIGISGSTKWRGVETVMSGRGVTRTYLDLSVRTDQVYAKLIEVFVGSHDYLEHVFQRRTIDAVADRPLVEAAGVVHGSIGQVVTELTSVVPRPSLRVVFDVAAAVKRIGSQAQAAANPTLVSGVTGSGKSTLLSSLLAQSDLDSDGGNGGSDGPGTGQVEDGTDDLVQGLGLLAPFMKATTTAPGQTKQQHISSYTAFLVQHGLAMKEAANRTLGEIVETLFNPSHRGDTTATLPLLKLLTAGNPHNSSTHISTRILDGPALDADAVTVHFCSAEEIAEKMAKNPDLQRALGDKTEALGRVAGQSIVLHLPPASTRVQRNGQLRALFNTLHGVQDDPRPPLILQHPEIVRLIEFSRPLSTNAAAYQDQIGELERNRLLQNAEEGEHMVRCVVISHFNASAALALSTALDTTNPSSKRWVLVVYNVANNNNSEAELRKASTALANEARTSVHTVRQEIEDAFPAFIDNMVFVAFDPVSAAAMGQVLRMPQVLGVEHLWRLPLALKQTGLADFMYAQHTCTTAAALEVMEPVNELRRLLARLETWGRDCAALQISGSTKTALRALPADTIAEAALKLGIKRERIKPSNDLERAMLAAYDSLYASGTGRDHDEPFTVDVLLVLEILKQAEHKAAEEVGEQMDKYLAGAATRTDKQAPFVHLRKLTALLEQDTAFSSEEEEVVRAQCTRIWDDMAVKLVYDTHTEATPFAGFACTLKTMALDVATLFVYGACHHMSTHSNGRVQVTLLPPTSLQQVDGAATTVTTASASIETLLLGRLCVESVSVDGRLLAGQELEEYTRVLWEMGKVVAFRVVEQQCISTLKIETALEPTADMVGRSVLHYLRGRRDRLVQLIKDASEEGAALKIVKMIKEALDRSFKGFTIPAALLHLTGAHHPGAYVVSDSLLQRHDGRDFLVAWLKEQAQGLLGTVGPYVKQATSHRKLLEFYVQHASSILSPHRRGLVPADAPRSPAFPAYTLYEEGSLYGTRQGLLDVLSTGGATYLDGRERITEWAARKLHLDIDGGWDRPFASLREVLAQILGIHPATVTVEAMDLAFAERRVKDVDAIHEYYAAKALGGTRFHDFYEAYKAQHETPVAPLVKTLMQAVAAITPGALASTFLSDRPLWRRYVPSTTLDLTVTACLDEMGRLKEQEVLGTPDYVYNYLRSLPDPSTATLRRALEELETEGEDLVSCLVFELLVAALIKKQAIALVVYNGTLQHHVFRPQLRVDVDGGAEGQVEGGAEAMAEEFYFGPRGYHHTMEPIDVIAVWNNQYYLLTGVCKQDDDSMGLGLLLDADLELLARVLEEDECFFD